MLKMLGRLSLASALTLLGTSTLFAQGSFILGAEDFPDWGGIGTAPGPFSGVTVVETEANDDFGTADAIAIGDDYTGSIDALGADEDYTSFFVAASGDSIVATTVAVGGLSDTLIRLYATDGVTELAVDDDGGVGLLSELSFTFTASGTYFLAVESFGSNTGAYSMEVRAGGAPVAEDSWIYVQKALEAVAPGVTRAGHDGSVAVLGSADNALGSSFDTGAAYHELVPLAAANTNLSGTVTFHEGVPAITAFFADLAGAVVNPQIIVLAGSGATNDLDAAEAAEIDLNAAAIAAYINSGGGLISHGDNSFGTPISYGWLSTFIAGATVTQATVVDPLLTPEGQFRLPAMDDTDRLFSGSQRDGTGYFENHGLDVFMTSPGDPVTGPWSGTTVAESEANDDFSTANAMVVGDDYAGSIDAAGLDMDFASFAVLAGDLVHFETVTGGTLGDTLLHLYDTDGTTLITSNDDGGSGLLSLIDHTFAASGTYFVRVTSFGTNTGTYTMETRLSVPGPDREVVIGRLPSAWDWLGNSLAGVDGEPLLVPTGTLAPSSPLTMNLSGAAPTANSFLVLSLTNLSAPFKGGVLVPSVQYLFLLQTDSSGNIDISGSTNAATVPGTTFFGQYWITDAAGPAGYSASNALSGTYP